MVSIRYYGKLCNRPISFIFPIGVLVSLNFTSGLSLFFRTWKTLPRFWRTLTSRMGGKLHAASWEPRKPWNFHFASAWDWTIPPHGTLNGENDDKTSNLGRQTQTVFLVNNKNNIKQPIHSWIWQPYTSSRIHVLELVSPWFFHIWSNQSVWVPFKGDMIGLRES